MQFHIVNRKQFKQFKGHNSKGQTNYNTAVDSSSIDRRYYSQGEQRKNGSNWDSYYYTRDHLGSIREVVKSDGTLAARYDYDPYGKRSAQYQASTYVGACDLGFTGHITIAPSTIANQPEMVLTFFRAYDPGLGRWLSADPLGEEGGLNLYQYSLNSPIGIWDPDGLSPAWALYFPDFRITYPDLVSAAASQSGSGAYGVNRFKSSHSGTFLPLSNKCNQFVGDSIYKTEGFPAPLITRDSNRNTVGRRIPTAEEWANPAVNIPGFGAPHRNPQPGDVVTSGIPGTPVGGHMGILGKSGVWQASSRTGKVALDPNSDRYPIGRTPCP